MQISTLPRLNRVVMKPCCNKHAWWKHTDVAITHKNNLN